MVAKIKTGKSIPAALGYNERKVRCGVASVIGGGNLVMDPQQMTVAQKVRSFERLTSLRADVKSNSIHIFLSFNQQDTLEGAQLAAIAEEYLQGIGLGMQPYIAYRHDDTSHPHLHLVTTNVTAAGKRIDLNGVGRTASELTRQALEVKYGLLPAQEKRPERALSTPIQAYGQGDMLSYMNQSLETVLATYRLGSLAELNVVLFPYNLRAFPDKGGKAAPQDTKNGLLYSHIDKRGNRKGRPIVASQLPCRPTAARLAPFFEAGTAGKEPLLDSLRLRIEDVLKDYVRVTPEELKGRLQAEKIELVLRRNNDGQLIGLTFHDTAQRTVVNSSLLGASAGLGRINGLLGEETLAVAACHKELAVLAAASQKLQDGGGVYAFQTPHLEPAARTYLQSQLQESTPGLDPGLAAQLTAVYIREQAVRGETMEAEDRQLLAATVRLAVEESSAEGVELYAKLQSRGILVLPVRGGIRFQLGKNRKIYVLELPQKGKVRANFTPGEGAVPPPVGEGTAPAGMSLADQLLENLLQPQEGETGPSAFEQPARKKYTKKHKRL